MRNMMMATTTNRHRPSNRLRLNTAKASVIWRYSLLFLSASLPLTVNLFAQNPGSTASVPQQPPPISAGFSPGVKNIPISPGDMLDVQVFNTPELSTRLRVDQLGRIALPLGGEVEAKGLTVAAAADAIKMKLISSQIMLHPMVLVNIMEYATEGVTVLGEVRSPGIYTLLGPHSLYDALASAGGATSSAGSSITITHADDADHPVIVKVTTPNYSAEQKATIIQPGDTIVVSKAELVYIVGDVTRSGAFYIQNGQPLTVLELVSLAQGTTRTSAMARAAIVRPSATGSAVTIPINLDKVMKNQTKNVALEAGDILVIPRSGWKTFEVTAFPTLVSGAVSVGAVSAEPR
jgi:polysaccharide export outer membrane protein